MTNLSDAECTGYSREIKVRLLVIAGIVLALYAPMLVKLVRYWWEDDNYTHGFFVPFIIGYVIWENRHRLARLPWVGSPWLGACVVCGSILLYWAGILGAELFVTRFALVVTLCGLLLYFGGFTHLRNQLFCLALFSLTIPIPAVIFNQIALPLQLFASDIATRLIALWGIPALREGNVIELMQMKLQVVEACSGIRSLVSLAALSLTIAQMAQAKAGIRFIMLAASIPVAVIVNALRVAATGLTAHYYGAGVAEGFMHGFSSWVMFLLSLLLLLALLFVLQRYWRAARVRSLKRIEARSGRQKPPYPSS